MLMLMAAVLCMGMANASDVKTSFAVNGKCGMCKKKIEAAAKSIDGVEAAKWCPKGKKLTVQFDDSKTSVKAIQKKVASIGYDTEKYKAKTKVYNALPECCKYRENGSTEIKGSCCGKEGNQGGCSEMKGEMKAGKAGSCCGEKKAEKEMKAEGCCNKK